MAPTNHPIFARFYRRLSEATADGVAKHRLELLAGLSGRVVEVGCGNGLNFEHYPAAVTEVLAIEPEPYLRAIATERARELDRGIRVVAGDAASIPANDSTLDAAVCSLVLCTLDQPAAALAEIRRVLTDAGELRFYEHVLGDGRLATVQQRINPVWHRVFGGCNCNRDSAALIEAAGFDIDRMRTMSLDIGSVRTPVSPHILGCASVAAPAAAPQES